MRGRTGAEEKFSKRAEIGGVVCLSRRVWSREPGATRNHRISSSPAFPPRKRIKKIERQGEEKERNRSQTQCLSQRSQTLTCETVEKDQRNGRRIRGLPRRKREMGRVKMERKTQARRRKSVKKEKDEAVRFHNFPGGVLAVPYSGAADQDGGE